MEKVKINEDSCDMYGCSRCASECDTDGWYCNICNPKEKVDFDFYESMSWGEINWKDMDVCPWCYNQLLEKFQKKGSIREREENE